MKIVEVIPLYKGQEMDSVVNYCPISLLMTMSKVLEKHIYSCVYKFLKANSILYESQYGIHTKCCCEQAIAELLGHIPQGKELGQISSSIFLDLSKAFDRLKHIVILKKLEQYGVCRTPNA